MEQPTEAEFTELLRVTQIFHSALFRLVDITSRHERQAKLDTLTKHFTAYGNILGRYGHLVDPAVYGRVPRLRW